MLKENITAKNRVGPERYISGVSDPLWRQSAASVALPASAQRPTWALAGQLAFLFGGEVIQVPSAVAIVERGALSAGGVEVEPLDVGVAGTRLLGKLADICSQRAEGALGFELLERMKGVGSGGGGNCWICTNQFAGSGMR